MKEQDTIKKLETIMNLKKEMASKQPLVEILKSEIKSQKTPHSIYQVMIDCLWGDLDEIQKNIKYLEEKLDFETEVYERLKNICLSLTFDEENLHILETGSFTNDDDLVKMEKSLSILSDFSKGEYTLKIIKEREVENFQTISKFLNRFLIYISKMFVKSEGNSKLSVHSSLYSKMEKFKFIYKFSKTNKEYFGFLCNAYTKKSMDLYNTEFKTHLNRVAELVEDAGTLAYTIDTILMIYQSLVECEIKFMGVLGVESDPKDIFMMVDMMIIDFIDLFFSKLPYTIVKIVFKYTSEDYKNSLKSLYSSLLNKRKMLEEVFIHQRKNTPVSFEFVDLMNSIPRSESTVDFINSMTSIFIKQCEKTDLNLNTLINLLQLTYCINELDGKENLIERLKTKSTPKILEHAFGEDNNIEKIFKIAESKKPGYTEINKFLNAVIIENAEDLKKNELNEKISRIIHK